MFEEVIDVIEKLNLQRGQKMIRDWQSEFFLIILNLLKLLADLNTSNQHN